MSATAYLFLENEILLASDGAEWDINGNLTGFDTKKLYQVSDSIYIVWMGRMYYLMPIIKKETKHLNSVKEVAEVLGNILEEATPQFLSQFPEADEDYLYAVSVVGYDESGERNMYQLCHLLKDKDHAYTPREYEIRTNSCTSAVYDEISPSLFNEIMQEEINKTPRDLQNAFKIAFTRLVEHFKSRGAHVGGELFFERILPKKVLQIIDRSNKQNRSKLHECIKKL